MAKLHMEELDKKLLALVQRDVPVVARPWGEIGSRLGIKEQDVLDRLAALKAAGVIRQISAIFDTASLGYISSLVAARIEPERLEAAAAVINAHPGVSHNYQRDHTFNLWYTLAVSPQSRLGLERTVQILHERSGAQSTRLLPALYRFKIGVILDVADSNDVAATNTASQSVTTPGAATPLTESEIRYVREMQQDLPLQSAPFLAIAERLGITLAELQRQTMLMRQCGRLRRIAAVLRHRQLGFTANGMAVWIVRGDEPTIRRFGAQIARYRAVTHCYLRPTYPDWPYNLFAMIHARTQADCQAVTKRIATETGLTDYAVLYSLKEYKKVRPQYFTDAETAWETQHGA